VSADAAGRGVDVATAARGDARASAGPATTGARPAVPALLWLLPAIALQATVAALDAGTPPTFELSIVQGLASLAAIVGGGALIRAAVVELDWNATPVCVDAAPRALVATGPYRHGRHPTYLGAALVLAGTALALDSLAAGGVAAAYFAWLDLGPARREDAVLQARFGPAWRAYAARTRRWI